MINCQVEENSTNIKLDSNREELFFKDIPNKKITSKEGNSIEIFLENENKETQFLQKLSDQKGIPIWENSKTFKNKSLTNKNSESSITIIPLTDNDKNLSSLLFADIKNNGKSTIYTITNEQLFKIVNNPEIAKETREIILIQFLYFDYLSFGRRLYTNIPADLFSNIKVKKNNYYKEFKIRMSTEQTTTLTSRQVSDICVSFNFCDGRCHGACDECSSCQSTRCYGFGGSTAPGNFGSSEGGSGDPGSTGGGSSGGGTTSSIPWYLMNSEVDIFKYPSNIRNIFKRLADYDIILQRQQLDYLKTNTILIQKLERFLTNNNLEKSEFTNITIDVFMDNGDKVFFNWAIDYLIQNPNVTISQFQNWFMGTSEGQDGDYDADYWENPNLTFQQQNLPTLTKFKDACPSKYTDAGTLCNNLGGDVLKMYNAVIGKGKKLNTCAIRVSSALNKCGIVIPSLPDSKKGFKNTIKDKDGNYLIINAKSLNEWMRKTFGTNPVNYRNFTAIQGGVNGVNFPKLMEDIKSDGIYSMVSRPEIQENWGTGHADILEDGNCRIKCHFYDDINNFVPVDYIDVWILK